MRRHEIEQRFDDIVAFSELEKFIDTPVKHYSSGMWLRLGFSVAAHLQTEIMIVDEVLAVGDADFRRKCLEHMSRATYDGRTVLLVSHDMSSIMRLCKRTIWLDNGKIMMDGDTGEVIERYLSSGHGAAGYRSFPPEPGAVGLISIGVVNERGDYSASIPANQPFSIEMTCELREDIAAARAVITIATLEEMSLLTSTNIDHTLLTRENPSQTLSRGRYRFAMHVPQYFMNVGSYSVNVNFLGQPAGEALQDMAWKKRVMTFHIEELESLRSYVGDKRRSAFAPIMEWTVTPQTDS
jgi:lipopolysaccharide transport system ATP-binding protein